MRGCSHLDFYINGDQSFMIHGDMIQRSKWLLQHGHIVIFILDDPVTHNSESQQQVVKPTSRQNLGLNHGSHKKLQGDA